MEIANETKKILIIGANGLLGTHILELKNKKDIINQKITFIAADLENTHIEKNIPFYKIDITNREETIKNIIKISPNVIILTAAITDVDQNEINKELATNVNTNGPKNVVEACKRTGAKLVFISTDFVFDGISKAGNYNEKNTPNPQSHYGKTKYDAELAIINSKIDYLICRTAVLYGWNEWKENFITWVLNKLRRKEKISIVSTQINNATLVENLAEIILKLIEKNAKGIYHTAGDGALSRYEIALKCAEIFDYDTNLITSIEEFKQKAIRPKNAGLNINKLKNLIGNDLKIYNLDDGLIYMKNHRDMI